MPASRSRWRLLTLVIALVGLSVLGPAPAFAQSGGCEEPPVPEYPGTGTLVPLFDPAPMGNGHPGSAYDAVGYAGLIWHTYGYSGSCVIEDPYAGIDTSLGNYLFSAAKTITAATNGMYYLVQDGGWLRQIDQFVQVMSGGLYDGVFAPYVALALTLAAMWMLWASLQGNLANIGRKGMWILAGLWLAASTYLTPLMYTNLVDQLLVHGANSVQRNLLQTGAGLDNNDVHALPTLLHRETVYEPWLVGTFGAEDNPQAEQYGRDLLRTHACTKMETLQSTCDTDAKQERHGEIAEELRDTPVWETFTGASHNRLGAGAFALVRALLYDGFQLVCQLGIVLAQIIVRVVITGGPLLGLLAILSNDVLPKMARQIGNALGGGLILVVAASVHMLAIGFILRPELGLAPLAQLLLAGLLAAALWLAIRPWERLTQMTASTVGASLPSWHQRRQTRAMRARSRSDRRRRLLQTGGRVDRWIGARAEAVGGPDHRHIPDDGADYDDDEDEVDDYGDQRESRPSSGSRPETAAGPVTSTDRPGASPSGRPGANRPAAARPQGTAADDMPAPKWTALWDDADPDTAGQVPRRDADSSSAAPASSDEDAPVQPVRPTAVEDETLYRVYRPGTSESSGDPGRTGPRPETTWSAPDEQEQ